MFDAALAAAPAPALLLLALAMAAAAALLTAILIVRLKPLMERYAMARPTARGLHATPTPQGGGLAIIGAVEIVSCAFWLFGPPLAYASPSLSPALLLGACAFAALGGADDVLTLSARFRLLAQFAVAAPLTALVLRASPLLDAQPAALWIAASAACSVGVVWFVNLTNFMDGMDAMTVVGLGVPTAFLALAHLTIAGDGSLGLVCAAALGGLIGFAPFNWPKARLFLGDVGSLSLGLIVGVALLHLAARGHVLAALIAPLYYLCDATITLLQRWRRGENLAQAHRTHFYQRAVTGGMSVRAVLARVGALNLALAALAGVALAAGDGRVGLAALLAAAALVALTLRRLARGA
jgi:UDP-N-acetylmuramyl pentapeptide phosphotransferase/UDP-N-acetylglucosamine-1-phosphate transferase